MREQISGGDMVKVVTRALQKVGGYFVFASGGDEYVVIAKKEFDRILSGEEEKQLTFMEQEPLPEEAGYQETSQFNQDVALARGRAAGVLPEEDTLVWVADKEGAEEGKTVRFEPIRGDLPPELQE